MHAVLPSAETDWPLYNAAASRALERAALQRHPPHTLIEKAGHAVARLALALVPHGRTALVLAGPGNNGGDALVAARRLAACGWQVRVHRIGPLPAAGSDAAHALQAALAAGLEVHQGAPDEASLPQDIHLWLDGLLGLGTRRAPAGELARAIRMANAHAAPTLAIDLPSGLDPDTGQPLGPDTVVVAHTLALLTLKPGLFTGEGRACSGQVWLDALDGMGAAPPDASVADASVVDDSPPDATATLAGLGPLVHWQRRHAPAVTSHKGRQGDVAVLGGAPGMRGAAWLAATAALAAGAGRVYAALPDDDGHPWPARPELMHWPRERWARPQAWGEAVVVCGCGGGDALLPWLDAVLQEARHLVLDADGLNLVAADDARAHRLTTRSAEGRRTILTPHPLEAARLLKLDGAAAVQADRLSAAQALAERFQCTVVLKGSGSIIAAPGERPVINSTGSPALATAGTGDVLAGWTGGLWAQALQADASEVALAATVWHGAAASGHKGPLLAADLVEAMARLHR